MKIKPAFLDRSAAAEYVSLGLATMEGLVQKGKFPAPFQLTEKRVGWLVTEIDEWAASRPRSAGLPVANCGRNQ